jgi:hypothetical protein
MKLILNNTIYEVEHTSDAFSIIEDYCEESGYVMGYISMNGKNLEVEINHVEFYPGSASFITEKAIIKYD